MTSKKRVAIFQAYHPLQVHTLNIAESLASSGYVVDLFLFKCKYDYVDTTGLKICIHDLSLLFKSWDEYEQPIQKFIAAVKFFIIEPFFLPSTSFLPKSILRRSKEILSHHIYSCFIGVEKMGLVWGGILTDEIRAPLLYYSLELFDMAFVFHLRGKMPFLKAFRFIREKMLESIFHRKVSATIIQDEYRAQELMRYNNVRVMNNLYLPVSLPGKIVSEKSDFLRRHLSIPKNKFIVLQFGIIEKKRLVLEVAREARKFPDDWVLVFHGPVIESSILNELHHLDTKGKVIISTNNLQPDKINDLVNSADIGLCFYGNKKLNDYLAGFSSEKLTRYLQCGIPVVAFNYPTFELSVGRTHSGVCISDLSQLVDAIEKIRSNTDYYRRNAFKTFEEYFEFSRQFTKVQNYINTL
jgi:glycosyltransferase involved in cell wall biosynthesis